VDPDLGRSRIDPDDLVPSICARMRSGLTTAPQSTTTSTRGTVTSPLSLTAASTTIAT
jgi:hypothetical protein